MFLSWKTAAGKNGHQQKTTLRFSKAVQLITRQLSCSGGHNPRYPPIKKPPVSAYPGLSAPLGEANATGHEGWTNFLAYNAGSTSAVTLGGGGGGSVGMAATKCFTVSVYQDRMAYYLKRKMYTGSNIQRVTLDFMRANSAGTGFMHYKVVMENVYVTAIEEADMEDTITMNISFTLPVSGIPTIHRLVVDLAVRL